MAGTDPNAIATPPTRPRRAFAWVVLFLVYTLIAVLLTGYKDLDDLTRQHPGTFYLRVLEESTGVYSVFLLLPLVFRYARVYLFERKGWLKLGLFHLAAAIAFSAAHTSMVPISRHFLSPLMGLGAYDSAILPYRYPLSLSTDPVGFT